MSLTYHVLCHACRRSQRRLLAATPVRGLATAAPRASAGGSRVKLVEVGPRDGLQNEKVTIPVETKTDLIRRLARAGLSTIEAGSFVRPEWVPQMANSADILQTILASPPPSSRPVSYAFLVPNSRGLDTLKSVLAAAPPKSWSSAASFSPQGEPAVATAAATATATDTATDTGPGIEIAVFAAATESFSRGNLNCSVDESLAKIRPVIADAKALGLRTRAYLSVVLGCPFEGPDVDPHTVARLATELLEAGADEISLGDTTGMGTAPRTQALLRCIAEAGVRPEDVAMHFHDTYGQALVNTAVSLEHGIRIFDCSVAGLGGCPYSPGATGNVATEDVVYFVESLGMDTGVDLDRVADIGAWISTELGRAHASSVGKAVLGARRQQQQPEDEEQS